MAIDPDEFRAALSCFTSGITVVTTKDARGRFHGITVSAFCSVSLEPSLVLVCIEKTTGSHQAIMESGVFVVNVLSALQNELSERFASQITYKFEGVQFRLGVEGVPILDGALVNLECRLKNVCEGGDHTIFVGEVENAQIRDGSPLLYFHGNYHGLVIQ